MKNEKFMYYFQRKILDRDIIFGCEILISSKLNSSLIKSLHVVRIEIFEAINLNELKIESV